MNYGRKFCVEELWRCEQGPNYLRDKFVFPHLFGMASIGLASFAFIVMTEAQEAMAKKKKNVAQILWWRFDVHMWMLLIC